MRSVGILILCSVVGCGDETDPTDVTLGETTVVAVINPEVNDANSVNVPSPGTDRSGVGIEVTDGPSGTTNDAGITVLAPVPSGARTLVSGDLEMPFRIAARELREIAIAKDGSNGGIMSDVGFAFGGAVVEVSPEMSVAEVNDALAESNTIVLFAGGEYVGDLSFAGSNVTLFGATTEGGRVTIRGNVTVNGSANRVRGTTITGNLTVPGSDVGISFARVEGDLSIPGSDAHLLQNEVCGTTTIAGSGTLAVGNLGMAPLAAPSECP